MRWFIFISVLFSALLAIGQSATLKADTLAMAGQVRADWEQADNDLLKLELQQAASRDESVWASIASQRVARIARFMAEEKPKLANLRSHHSSVLKALNQSDTSASYFQSFGSIRHDCHQVEKDAEKLE